MVSLTTDYSVHSNLCNNKAQKHVNLFKTLCCEAALKPKTQRLQSRVPVLLK